jgi:cysteinyl-tRNA synthetase
MEYLGDTLDIHTGGEDNIFPHHEAEIAQSEAFSGKKFVNFWIHVRHLLVDGQKMSKSKGNFYLLSDILEKGYSPMELRLLILSSHYRSQMNFTWKAMEQAKANLQRINDFILNMEVLASHNVSTKEDFDIQKFQEKFEAALDDDLNTPLALSVIFELITEVNKKNDFGSDNAKKVLSSWKKINSVLGFTLSGQAEIPEEIKKLASERKKARDEKDFAASDKFRNEIENLGYIIEDAKDGEYKIKKK